jgi:hypothetical protein
MMRDRRWLGLALLCLFAVGSVHGRTDVDADWLDGASVSSMPVRPADDAAVLQSNPDFSWPAGKANVTYRLEIFDVSRNRIVSTETTGDNWLTARSALAAGPYRWRVSVVDGATGRWRTFSVREDAAPFALPEWPDLFETVRRSSYPRSFPGGLERQSMERLLNGERAAAWRKLADRVRAVGKRPPVSGIEARKFASEKEKSLWTLALPKQVDGDIRQVEEASVLWLVTGRTEYLDEGKRRVLALASLDPDGATAYEPSHHAPRNLLWALVIGFDRFHVGWTKEERELLLGVIDRRLGQIERALDGRSRALRSMPYDSHGWMGLQGVAAMFAVVGPELPNGEARFKKWLPWALGFIGPWGGEDGGYANGTAYATWNVEILIRYWDAIRSATGIDVYSKPSVRNLARFFAYFTPPGAFNHVFGDAAEKRPAQYMIAGLAMRVASKEAQWLRDNLRPEEPSNLIIVAAPAPPVVPGREPDSSSMWSRSTGWVAMHSDLLDNNRVSVYFKSSPYGTSVHSHADQNSFVMHRAGKAVLIDSGYYDWYGSPHRNAWYQTTRAHNAITMDGGLGQTIGSVSATGAITGFGDRGPVVFASGDATKAYGGAVTFVGRTLVYFRSGDLVVIDFLRSDVPRIWEWNFHGDGAIVADGADAARVRAAGGDVCLRSLREDSVQLSVGDVFPVNPENVATAVPQWHGTFATRKRTSAAVMAFQVSASCSKPRQLSVELAADGGLTLNEVAMGPVARIDSTGVVRELLQPR